METKRSEDVENENTAECVRNGMPRRDHRIARETGYRGPVKSQRKQPQSGCATKDLVDDGVLWEDPRDEDEDAEELQRVSSGGSRESMVTSLTCAKKPGTQ